ncbi:MAG TPA: zinc-dependent metalloprotease [Acidimicrobiales bacterium]|nr:zinc-dependent metalloprotease [Acidimicrobiales bacterium]
MDPDLPAGMGGFFPGMLGDLLRLLKSDAPIQWDLALQLAQRIASDDAPEANVDPVDRMRLEGLLGVAELHVADVTGMTTTPLGQPLSIVATGPAEWARRSLEGWRPVIEQIAAALAPASPGAAPSTPDPDASPDDELVAFVGQWTTAVAPAMIAMQVGSIVGHLAQRALGQYELPLPRRADAELLVVPANARRFAEDWSLPPDDLLLWLCVHDVATHAVLTRPHVRARLESLLVAQARGFRPDPKALEQRLGEAVSGSSPDLSDLTRLLGDPGAFGEIEETPEIRRVRAELSALSSAIAGYAAWVTDTVAARAIGARGAIAEAMRRRRVERGDEERVAESLFGLHLDQDAVDRGEAFVRGVVERSGDAELTKLWVVETDLPTPAELDAPGLWLERVNLPSLPDRDDPGGTA